MHKITFSKFLVLIETLNLVSTESLFIGCWSTNLTQVLLNSGYSCDLKQENPSHASLLLQTRICGPPS